MTEPTVRVLGIFAHSAPLLESSRCLRELEHRDLTTFSPVPLYETGKTLWQDPIRVRLLALGGGLAGAVLGFALTIATSLHYPLITGGKPIVYLPSFAIIAFQLAILCASLGATLGLLWNMRLPRLRLQPGYDPRFSEDRFGLHVRCPQDQSGAVQQLLWDCGAQEVHCEET